MRAAMSSAAVAPRDRFDWFTDVVARSLAPTAIRCEDPGGFRADAAVLDLGPVQVSTFHYAPLRSRRTPELIRRGDPEQYQLALVTGGPMWIAQQRADSGPVSGDLLLWDTSHPYEAGAPGDDGAMVRAVVLQIPRTALPLHPDRVDRLLAQRIPAGRGTGAVLAQFLASVDAHAQGCGERELAHLGGAALGLAAACLAERLDVYDDLPAEARDEVLLRQIDAFIEHNLGDPELTPGWSPPVTTSRCAACTCCSRSGRRGSPPASGAVGWRAAAPTCCGPGWPGGPSTRSPPAGASPARPSSAARSARPTEPAPRNAAERPHPATTRSGPASPRRGGAAVPAPPGRQARHARYDRPGTPRAAGPAPPGRQARRARDGRPGAPRAAALRAPGGCVARKVKDPCAQRTGRRPVTP